MTASNVLKIRHGTAAQHATFTGSDDGVEQHIYGTWQFERGVYQRLDRAGRIRRDMGHQCASIPVWLRGWQRSGYEGLVFPSRSLIWFAS